MFCATNVFIASPEVGRPLGLELAEEAEHLEDARLAARLGHALHARGRSSSTMLTRSRFARPTYASAAHDLLRVAELLAPSPNAIDALRVDDEVDGEVLLFLVEAHEELLEALVDVPVEVAEVVAGLVVAVVGELDAAAALLRPPLGAQPPGEDAPADEREVLELALELVVEEVVVLGGGGLRARDAERPSDVEEAHARSPS